VNDRPQHKRNPTDDQSQYAGPIQQDSNQDQDKDGNQELM
jgi:hypothetical protein